MIPDNKSNIIYNPWNNMHKYSEGTLLSLGTGLTFIDNAATWLHLNKNNKVIGISRNGEIPNAHADHLI